MVMKREKTLKNICQPDPYKIIINTCLLLFFQPVYGSSLYEPVANGKKALSRGSTLKGLFVAILVGHGASQLLSKAPGCWALLCGTCVHRIAPARA
jgi:hypothetical protein